MPPLQGEQVNELSLPEIGGAADSVLSQEQENILGRTLIREARSKLHLNEDPELNSYIQSLGLSLVANNPDGHPNFTFIIIDDPLINAFALPGGIVGINTGLIAQTESEAELASVMSHEIAHVTQRHLARMYAQSGKTNLATGLGILAAILASAYDPQLGEAALISTIAANAQHQLNFTRANEEEADRIGIKTLAGAGYDPHAMAVFFDKMRRLSHSLPDAIPEYLSTHPVSNSRITDSMIRADQYPGPFNADTLNFQLAKARLQALQTTPRTLIALYEKADAGKPKAADSYGYALALIRDARPGDAIGVLQQLIKNNKSALPYQLALAWALSENKQAEAAIRVLADLDRIYPRYEPIVIAQAQTLIDLGRPQEALSTVDGFIATGRASPNTYRLKARAASNAKLPAISHEALAEYYFEYGQYATALQHIEIALKTPGLDEVSIARLRTERDTLIRVRKQLTE